MRNITADMIAEFSGQAVEPILMGECYFDTQVLRMWTGFGSLMWGEKEFFGGGNFIGISPIEETQEIQAKGIVVSLNGIPSNLISLALGERSRGRKFVLYLAVISTGNYVELEDESGFVEVEDGDGYVLLENQLLDSPLRLFSGLMDVIEFTDNGQTADLRLSVENSLIIGQRPKIARYTPEDQKKLYPLDQGYDFINQLQDKELVW